MAVRKLLACVSLVALAMASQPAQRLAPNVVDHTTGAVPDGDGARPRAGSDHLVTMPLVDADSRGGPFFLM